jgi:VacB/RNase II family 3'-5' exoribonuclease
VEKNKQPHRVRLQRIARRAMAERGLLSDFSSEVITELDSIASVHPPQGGARVDLRSLLWASIDNDDSMDLDQLTVAESLPGDVVKIRVAIADVDTLVEQGRAIDDHARHNTTSVYTAAENFPMLPEKLSYGLTSLGQDEDRPAIVIEMVVDAVGSLASSDIYTATVRNRAKLAYNSVAQWLEGEGPVPDRVAGIEGLEANLRLQDQAAQRLKRRRHEHGALDLQTIEARPVFDGDRILDLEPDQKNRARELIEDFMVAANGVTALFLESKHLPSLRRVVRVPKRWERIVELAATLGYELPENPDSKALGHFLSLEREADPLRFPDLSITVVKLMGAGEYAVKSPGESATGHFGLAVRDYAHSTAPNRRFPDLITQRLVKAALSEQAAPYDEGELLELARHCTHKEDDADKVERRVGKSAAALLLESRIGEKFDAIVTGASAKGTWVRILALPVEGMLVEGAKGVDVGDRLRVQLIDTDVERGYIDFKRTRP